MRLTIIYGKSDLQDTEREWMHKLSIPAETWFVPHLHAKCYLNEHAAIITSMNLYEFSQQNNEEMGILVTKEGDQHLYQNIHEDARRLRRMAEGKHAAPVEASRPSPSEKVPAANSRQQQSRLPGFCIRCSTSIDLDPEKPYCGQHYRVWARYGDETYGEKFCHRCGKEHATSMAKPLCLPCYRQE